MFKSNENYNSIIIKFDKKLVGGPEASKFHDFLSESLEAKKLNFILDMSGVKFVNSTGIGIIVRGFKTIKDAGGDMKLAGLSSKIEGVLSITKLTSVFSIYGTVEEAEKSF
jgi:anti-sigma B factor antagonist